jgi:Tfp pilus assembly protein PilN
MAGVFGLLAYEQLTLSGLQSERDYWMTPAKEVGVVKRRVAVIRLYMDQTYSALECLREIGERKPDGVFLNAMTYKKGEAIRLNGEADSADIVYTLKSNLTASPLFKNAEATLVGPNHDPRKNKYTFELRLSLPDTSGGAS